MWSQYINSNQNPGQLSFDVITFPIINKDKFINSKMFRQTVIRSIRPAIAYRPQVSISRNYGIVDAATQAVFGKKGLEEKKQKEGELENKVQEANLDGGRKIATKLDEAQDAAQNAKSSLEDAKDGAQSTIQNATEKVKGAAETVNKKTGKILADGIENAQETVKSTTGSSKSDDLASRARETIENASELAYEKRIELEEEEGREEVRENIKGYASLQDKGRKAPIEQNRPDDAM
ncbi:hypothetical protein CANMA_000074 [Candida margitis]|uniref:uncharacterized protein n=1 Tax=Candida margitis TaxID=1775924 RepID=UPI0022262E3D|nr:uncharacterized protein CANMA_000074 [Candida margitis]KAI5970914.1 hypothetical protein CANMA_000074 [Candida margitis]